MMSWMATTAQTPGGNYQRPHQSLFEMLEAGIPMPSNAPRLRHKRSPEETKGTERRKRRFIELLGQKWQKKKSE